MLPGADRKLKTEAVLYTAHYDHLGIRPDMPGDNIYNGAKDNATGCGILLEVARAYAEATAAAGPVDSVCLGHRRGAGTAGIGISRQASADSCRQDQPGYELSTMCRPWARRRKSKSRERSGRRSIPSSRSWRRPSGLPFALIRVRKRGTTIALTISAWRESGFLPSPSTKA